ncbi:hypothetical protein [Chryseobacterium shandongense]|uniref:hypothetical protein n=1 Tax=Chryseobacterium shandongense TaxID=1493872 RepID=UPI000F4E4897|nr:hypothetical protein [Chryseobacterium shandongense]AZA56350.1 hypothetical protein EG350_03715 [Chryseobacterium shandongense]
MKASGREFIDIVESYMEEISTFIINSEKSRAHSQKQYKLAEENIPKLSELKLMMDGLIVTVSNNFHTPVTNLNDKISYQIALSASYIRTHFLINDLIMSGDVIEAATLLRKQLEALTRLIEVEEKEISKLEKKTPNVNNVFNNSTKELYKQLSEIAHSSSNKVTDMISNFEEDRNRAEAHIYPQFSLHSLECYKFHVFIAMGFLGYFIKFAMKVYQENYHYQEDIRVFLILVDLHKSIDFLNNRK